MRNRRNPNRFDPVTDLVGDRLFGRTPKLVTWLAVSEYPFGEPFLASEIQMQTPLSGSEVLSSLDVAKRLGMVGIYEGKGDFNHIAKPLTRLESLGWEVIDAAKVLIEHLSATPSEQRVEQ